MALDHISCVKWAVDVSPIPCSRLAAVLSLSDAVLQTEWKAKLKFGDSGKKYGFFGRTIYMLRVLVTTCMSCEAFLSALVSCLCFFLPKVSFNSISRTPRVWETIRNRPRLNDVLYGKSQQEKNLHNSEKCYLNILARVRHPSPDWPIAYHTIYWCLINALSNVPDQTYHKISKVTRSGVLLKGCLCSDSVNSIDCRELWSVDDSSFEFVFHNKSQCSPISFPWIPYYLVCNFLS